MTILRIVEVDGGKYAVQKFFCFYWGFLCKSGDSFEWTGCESIQNYSLCETFEEADAVLNKTIERIKKKRLLRPKVIRVVKTVRV